MIKFDQVSKSFCRDDKCALIDINFEVDDGEFVFITGHSGCGKTTLLRLLLRELQPTSGKVYFADQDLRRMSARKVAKHRRQVGVVFQDYQLIDDLTVWENIALPLLIAHEKKAEINKRIDELLDLFDLADTKRFFPSQLSGGEAQRIGLARALVTAPKVIFADEPTGNLDDANAYDIVKLLDNINSYGTTVIVATHNLGLVQQVGRARLLEFERGHLISDTGRQIEETAEQTEEQDAVDESESETQVDSMQEQDKSPAKKKSAAKKEKKGLGLFARRSKKTQKRKTNDNVDDETEVETQEEA